MAGEKKTLIIATGKTKMQMIDEIKSTGFGEEKDT